VPARDQRTVGELLADSDALSRDTLLDVTPSQGPAMVRAWSPVVQSAAQLWAVLPPVSLAAPSGPDLMVRLRGLGEGIARSTAGHWPGPGPQDQRLLEIARNLSRARDLVERYGRDVQPTGAETRADYWEQDGECPIRGSTYAERGKRRSSWSACLACQRRPSDSARPHAFRVG
jgi:hypothetical protein